VKQRYRCASGILGLSLLLLSGCSLLPTTRKLPVPKAPSITQTVAPEELVAQLNQRWEALDALTATVEIQATELKTKEGLAKDLPSCRGYIVMRKPAMLRVVGQYFGVRVFNMASDGNHFTLYIPSKSKAIEGTNALHKRSANELENLRPGFFFDAMVVRGLGPDDFYSVTADTETVEDAAKKHLYSVPEYILSITHHNPVSRRDTPVRVITINRDDLLPSQQDLYDTEGNLETQVIYSKYADFGSGKYPGQVKIKRPLEGIEITLTVERVVENPKLPDDQFQIVLPEGTQIQNLE
jgi:outer membrane lipoprotein-sorting protein